MQNRSAMHHRLALFRCHSPSLSLSLSSDRKIVAAVVRGGLSNGRSCLSRLGDFCLMVETHSRSTRDPSTPLDILSRESARLSFPSVESTRSTGRSWRSLERNEIRNNERKKKEGMPAARRSTQRSEFPRAPPAEGTNAWNWIPSFASLSLSLSLSRDEISHSQRYSKSRR